MADTERDGDVAGSGQFDLRFRLVAGIGTEFVVELGECGVGSEGDLPTQPTEQMRPPLTEIDDPRRHPVGVQAHP